jgi:hypothetical protein
MPSALRNGGQLYAARKGRAQEEWLHLHPPWKRRPRIWHSPLNNRRFMIDSFIKSRHWANYTLNQAGLPKTF